MPLKEKSMGVETGGLRHGAGQLTLTSFFLVLGFLCVKRLLGFLRSPLEESRGSVVLSF